MALEVAVGSARGAGVGPQPARPSAATTSDAAQPATSAMRARRIPGSFLGSRDRSTLSGRRGEMVDRLGGEGEAERRFDRRAGARQPGGR
jgi:hypothetical protein